MIKYLVVEAIFTNTNNLIKHLKELLQSKVSEVNVSNYNSFEKTYLFNNLSIQGAEDFSIEIMIKYSGIVITVENIFDQNLSLFKQMCRTVFGKSSITQSKPTWCDEEIENILLNLK